MKKTKIGLLPLFIELYDTPTPSASRSILEPYYEKIAGMLGERGLEVITVPFCRIKPEFEEAVAKFEREGADAIVTLHMAYSPSLESIDALVGTRLPIIVLDSTVEYDFSPETDSVCIDTCHGIHGVMDMCSMLNQRGKAFAIAAGHADNSDVIDRVLGFVRAAKAATSLRGTSVGTIGGSFKGMGDFLISPKDMKKTFGVKVVEATKEELLEIRKSLTEEEIREERKANCEHFGGWSEFSEEETRPTEESDLAVRKWIEKHRLDAFTVNFMTIGSRSGLDAMPFTEACLEMSKGIGYAGEGDILTAAITGALLRGFGEGCASFVEIFCPDWKGDRVMLSHMGEMNLNLTQKKPDCIKYDFNYGFEAVDPIVPRGAYRGGEATYVNVCKDDIGYKLVAAPVKMLDIDGENFSGSIRGWMDPKMKVGKFLEKLSENGATHHSSLVYGATPEQMCFFAKLLGLRSAVIE